MENTLYQQSLDYIYSFVDYESVPRPRDAVHYDLRRMDELLQRLGDPHLKYPTVHITGTKGKGSTAAMVTSALETAGFRTGLYTSPHLHTFNERIRVGDRLIADDELVALVERLKPEVTAVNETATYGKLTTFELITALGFMHFEDKDVDFQVIEVGLGGRLDATNVVKPELCVITSISLDHTEVLGNTLTAIAGEKAGIIKPGVTVVSSPQDPEAEKVIRATCAEKQCPLVMVGEDITWEDMGFGGGKQNLRVAGRKDSYELSIPLLGEHQMINATAAVAALELLSEKGHGIEKQHITGGLANVRWPGRLQVLKHEPLLIVDGAHNPESSRRLRQSLEHYFTYEKAILIFGASSDKNIDGMITELAPLFDSVIVTHSIHPRAMSTQAIINEFRRHGLEARGVEDVFEAVTVALETAGEGDLICVTGSLFVVAGAIEQAAKLGLS